ncbi:MAG: subclass B3 metallo-beta-lactamase [Pseudomonadota bacterium]
MFAKIVRACVASTIAFSITATAQGQEAEIPADQQAFLDTCKSWDDWDKPAPPFEIYRDTHYVGTCGIAAILITDEEGHVLIDSGTEAGAEIVMANVKALGFDLRDIRYLLYSHEHFDHVGGMAKLQRATGAVVVASPNAEQVLSSGEDSPDDPQHGMHEPFEGMAVGRIMASGDVLTVGDTTIRAIETPGHSPGAMSWWWQECKERCENIAYADSLSPIGRDDYRFGDHPDYVAAYRAGLVALGREDCTIMLTPHPSHSRMIRRMQTGNLIENAPGIRPCASYAGRKLLDLETRLANEKLAQ